jgi:hypothetical protein
MASAGASDDSSPVLGSTTSSGSGIELPVSLGRGRLKVEGAALVSVAVESPSRPVAFTPTMTASPPSSPITTATPTSAISPVRTGRC